MPPPTAIVSAACASGVSPSAIAAAMPPCAHADDAPCPSGAAEISVTGRGASLSAQNNPARPPPTMMTSSELRVKVWMVFVVIAFSKLSTVVPATHNPDCGCCGKLELSACQYPRPVVMGPGSSLRFAALVRDD